MIQTREDLLKKIKGASNESLLTDVEKTSFLSLDYPRFDIELEVLSFHKQDHKKIQKAIGKWIGEIHSPHSDQILKIWNDKEYKIYKDSERGMAINIAKSRSREDVKTAFIAPRKYQSPPVVSNLNLKVNRASKNPVEKKK